MSDNASHPASRRSLLHGLLAVAGIAWLVVAFVAYYNHRPLDLLLRYNIGKGLPWLADFHSGWNGLSLDVLLQGLLLAWFAAVIGVIGWSVFRRLRLGESEIGALVWGSGMALGALGMLVFFLGIGGLIRWPLIVFGGLLVWLTLVAGWRFKSEKRDMAGKPPRLAQWRSNLSSAEWVVLLAIAGLNLLGLLYALTPAIQSDGLRYHLAAPQEWLKAGRLVYLPYNAFSNFPATIDMLFLLGLGLAGDLLAAGFHYLFFLLTTAAIGLITHEILEPAPAESLRRSLLGIRPGLLAALVWATCPIVLPVGAWPFIDLGVLFFTLGLVHFLLRWIRTRNTSEWVVAAVFGGLLVGSKYTGVMVVAFGALLMLVYGLSFGRTGRAGWVRCLLLPLCFGLLAAAIASPWWIRNAVNTGNPVYPLAYSVFKGGEWSETNAEIYASKLKQKGEGRSLGAFVRLPWSTATRPQHFADFEIGPFYWVISLWIAAWCALALARIGSNPARGSLALWLLFLLGTWFMTYQDNRFLMPCLALGTIIAVSALTSLNDLTPHPLRLVATGVFLLPVLYNGVDTVRWVVFDSSRTHWPAYTAGFLSRADYLARNLNYYRAAEYCNSMLTEHQKVLLVGEHRKFHWNCRVEGNDWYDQPRILPFLRESPDADKLLNNLKAAGLTHIFFNLAEWGWPEDPEVLTGSVPPPPASAWSFNHLYLNQADVAKIQDLLKSPRLRTVLSLQPDRVYLAEIQGDSQKSDAPATSPKQSN